MRTLLTMSDEELSQVTGRGQVIRRERGTNATVARYNANVEDGFSSQTTTPMRIVTTVYNSGSQHS